MSSFVRALALGALLAVLVRPAATAESPPAPSAAATLKAGFLLNFIRFTEWPADALDRNALTLCFVGRDPAQLAVAAVEGKTVAGRALRVQRAAGGEDLAGCNVVFVPAAEERRVPALLRMLASLPVLTVSDGPGFAESGGLIELVDAGDRFEFEVNLGAAQRAGLRPSAQMLKLARRVHGRPR